MNIALRRYATLVVGIGLSAGAVAHECTTTHPQVVVQNGSLTLFQTIVDDWDVLRDRIIETDAITLLEGIEAGADAVHTESASMTRSSQIEQQITDTPGDTWQVQWGLADHHGDCTEVQVQIRWPQGAWEPSGDAEWWMPVQDALTTTESL